MKTCAKLLVIIILTLVVSSCQKTTTIGGYAVTFNHPSDTIGGLKIGLYKSKTGRNIESVWTDFELLAETFTDEKGHFILTFDEDFEIAGAHFLIHQANDTSQVLSSFSNSYSPNRYADYSLNNNRLLLEPSVVYRFSFINFDFDTNLISVVSNQHINHGFYPGFTYSLNIYKRISIEQEELLGKLDMYFPKALPVSSEKVIWERPVMEIVIDKNKFN